jgi:pimeloyl-ACP methyl ester carboxylesterase
VSRRIAGQTLQAFLDDGKARLLADLEAAGTEGGVFVRFAATSWAMASPEGLYGNARGLVDLDPAFLGRFLALGCPRRFVYGAATYPPTTGKVTPDQPDPTALRAAGIGVAVVAGVGHALQIEAPEAVARVIAEEAET